MIAFDSRAGGVSAVHVMDAAPGAAEKQVTDRAFNALAPAWSHDGRALYFCSRRTGRWEVWKQPAAGGAAPQVTQSGGFAPMESEDGRFLYYAKRGPGNGLWRTPVEGGPETAVLASPDDRMWGYWTLAPAGLYYAAEFGGDAARRRSTY
jgi:Tol biopolymer transport system component